LLHGVDGLLASTQAKLGISGKGREPVVSEVGGDDFGRHLGVHEFRGARMADLMRGEGGDPEAVGQA
jgi:hypothetical protein